MFLLNNLRYVWRAIKDKQKEYGIKKVREASLLNVQTYRQSFYSQETSQMTTIFQRSIFIVAAVAAIGLSGCASMGGGGG